MYSSLRLRLRPPAYISASTSTSTGCTCGSYGTKQEHAGTAKPQGLAHGQTLGQ